MPGFLEALRALTGQLEEGNQVEGNAVTLFPVVTRETPAFAGSSIALPH